MLVRHRAADLVIQFFVSILLGCLKSLIRERRPADAMSEKKSFSNDVDNTSIVMLHQRQDNASLQS